ncbi:Efflux ABC transporter, permease protein [hydrothermal vent metagenome]|uniref:Efflux ABC transporter, permease protein n=1 Tax=hydrothermal vent metagenome TaxID=652676 RepID=A0A3B0TXN8_9ZZZZ
MSFAAPKPFPRPGVRRFGRVNWRGLWTLYLKEVRRFMKVGVQTILAPVSTTVLFLVVFFFALGRTRAEVAGMAFVEFLTPGLIMMAILQNAFANTSSSLLISKVQGNIVDILMPPLSVGELNLGLALGGLTRGLVVAVCTALIILPFVNLGVAHIWAVIWFPFVGAAIMSLTGIIGGIWAEKFDHMQAITNFVITPLAFLSGTFYSLKDLPGIAFTIAQFNPFFYLIDGFRYGVTGYADGNIAIGVGVTLAVVVGLYVSSFLLLRSGYHIKA